MNYHKHILEGLREWSGIQCNRKRQAKIDMLSRFIALMGEEHFNNNFEYYFMDEDNDFPDFDDGWYGFHKSMRQVDFFDVDEGGGHIDMLFWNFIHASDIPYDVFKVFTEKMKVGVIGDMDDLDDLDAVSNGWNKFGFFQIKRRK